MTNPVYRVAGIDDAGVIAAIYAPYVQDSVITFETEAPDRDEFSQRVARTTLRYPWLVAEIDGTVVGYAYACEHRVRRAYRWSVEVTVYLAPTAHRRGIGRGLYARLFELLRAQGYVNAISGITLPNAASIGLHEGMGFVRIAVYPHVGFKSGAWHDVGWWQRTLLEPSSSPNEPVAFPDLDTALIDRVLG